MVTKKYLLSLFVVLLIGSVLASSSLGNSSNSISNSYTKGDTLNGWINLSLTNEPSNSAFDTYFNNSHTDSISLIDLLKSDSRNKYSCDTQDCNVKYSTSSPEEEKTFTLNSGKSKLIGLKISNDILEVNSIKFNITSNAQKNCNNQLEIDLLDDGSIDAGNNKTSSEYCVENYGCYNPGTSANTEYKLDSSGYCQTMELDKSPGFEFGADIKADSIDGGVNVNLYKEGEWVDSCDIDESDISDSSFEKAYCNIDYFVKEKGNYSVCISYSGSSNYWIEGYTTNNGCGSWGSTPSEDLTSAYSIFAISKKFDAVGSLDIESNLENNFADLLNQYLNDNYDSLDCSSNGCVIPLKIKSNVDNQQITLNNLELMLQLSSGGIVKEKNLYDASKSNPLITTNDSIIYLDGANFSVPDNEGRYNLELKYKGNNLFSKNIEVQKGASIYNLYPTKTALNFPTNFVVSLDSTNVTEYTWDFGDGLMPQTSTTPNIKHTYTSLGTKTIIITITNSEGIKSSKSFNIQVGSAESVLEDLIDQYLDSINNIESEIAAYDSFSSNTIKQILNLDNYKNELIELKSNYSSITSGNENEYQALLSKLLEINIPTSIIKTKSAENIIFYPKESIIDLDLLSSITGDNYDSSMISETKNAILGWELDNSPITVSMSQYLANYDSSDEFLVEIFNINIKNLDSHKSSYLIVGDSLIFDNQSFDSSNEFFYKDLSDNENLRAYSTSEINIEDLPLFTSPSLSALGLTTNNVQTEEDNSSLGVLLIVLFIVIVLGALGYIFLKKWYSKKYESSLFKNKSDLYNIVNYVQSAKMKGMKDEDIKKNLRKAKWSNEKINYVMKKYSGKNTGMPGFSINKSSKKRI